MPQAVVYAAVAIFGEAVGTTIAAFFLSSTFLNFAIIYGASYLYGAFFAPKPKGGMNDVVGRQQMIRSSISPRNMIYGEIVTSGTLVYVATSFKQTTSKGFQQNQYLHLVIAMAAHEVQSIDEIYLNDEPLGALDSFGFPTSGKYFKDRDETVKQTYDVAAGLTILTLDEVPAKVVSVVGPSGTMRGNESITYTLSGNQITIAASNVRRNIYVTYIKKSANAYVRVKKYLGTPTQAADPDLIAEIPDGKWSSSHRLQGIAYVYVRLEYDPDIFASGIPTVRARIKGKKVLDPRTGTTAYSANWALCVYDYLLDAEGFDLDPTDIDVESVKTAANISDEIVSFASGRRYECHGTCLTERSPDDNLRQMLTAGGGTVVLSGGIMRIHAGAYDVPTLSLTDDDLRGSIKVQARTPRRDLFNAIKGTYVDGYKADSTWQPVDFPIQTNSFYETQDAGVRIVRDVELPFTKNYWDAERLAKMTLDRARQGLTVEFPAKLTAFKLRAWDTVSVTIAKFGWNAKVFRVVEWKLSSDGGVDLVLKEEAALAYQWNGGKPILFDPAPDTNLPIPGYVPPLTGLNVMSGSTTLLMQSDGTLVPRLRVAWNLTEAILIAGSGTVQVEYQLADDAVNEWVRLPGVPGDSTFTYVSPVIEGRAYLVRARLVSRRGVAGDWAYAPVHTAVGKSDLPSDVPWFIIDGDRLAWGGVDDVDLAGYRIAFQYGSNASWPDAAPLHEGLLTSSPYTPAVKPQGDITLMIKAVDTSGNESANATLISSAFTPIAIGNVVEVFDMQARGYAATFITD